MGVGVACTVGCTVGQGLFALSTASAIDLRQKVNASQQRAADDLRGTRDDSAQLRRSVLDLSNQVEVLRDELATVSGQNKRLTHDMANMQRSQNDMAPGTGERLRTGGSDGKRLAAKPGEKQEFEDVLATVRDGELSEAEAGLVSFMKRYPESGYRPTALFWLGTAQYALHNYRDAGGNFGAMVTAEPDHPHAPEALLSLADCQVELMDVKSARKTLEDILEAYPESEAAAVAEERLAKLR
ncbi:tol-pal system protein YbgF [Variovorax sp. WS11]|nr:tol-pal system protein YbgF [Variovorax sp. WS11]PSL80450.1 tol-pal system protein YbgF [Variovorax sp. WS11]